MKPRVPVREQRSDDRTAELTANGGWGGSATDRMHKLGSSHHREGVCPTQLPTGLAVRSDIVLAPPSVDDAPEPPALDLMLVGHYVKCWYGIHRHAERQGKPLGNACADSQSGERARTAGDHDCADLPRGQAGPGEESLGSGQHLHRLPAAGLPAIFPQHVVAPRQRDASASTRRVKREHEWLALTGIRPLPGGRRGNVILAPRWIPPTR
jgi:hypothetical protein